MSSLKLAGIFSDGMILQRDKEVIIWGEESVNDTVVISLDDKEYIVDVKDGHFEAALPPHTSSEGLEIIVRGSEEIVLHDICFGDVFILTGQSNMELPVSRTMDLSEDEVMNTYCPTIRQFRLTPQYRLDETKEATILPDRWIKAIPSEVMEMSAVGFYCATRMQKDINVPIGLILLAQGGSTIETWLSSEVLSRFGNYESDYAQFLEDNSLQRFLEKNNQDIIDWRNSITPADYERGALAIPEDAIKVQMPSIMLEKDGISHSGSFWMYKEFEVEEPSEDAFLYLGELVDSDQTFINGHMIGRTEYCYPPRKYAFDGSILVRGKNLLAVRLEINHSDGGFLEDHPYYLRVGSTVLDMAGEWLIAEETTASYPYVDCIMGQTIPTALYTSSIRPIRKLQSRGFWWYQGESNALDPYNKRRCVGADKGYDYMFKEMVDLWRDTFEQDLPILVVQMPDYVHPVFGMDEGWNVIQDMQLNAPNMVSKCATVSAKDLSEPYEIHPRCKAELGERMYKVAMDLFY